MPTVPALIREAGDRDTLLLGLVENVARENLSPVEEARGYAVLIDEFELSLGEVAERVGRSKPAISNKLRLLELSDDVLAMVERGELSEGHARAVLAVPDQAERRRFAREDRRAGDVRACRRARGSLVGREARSRARRRLSTRRLRGPCQGRARAADRARGTGRGRPGSSSAMDDEHELEAARRGARASLRGRAEKTTARRAPYSIAMSHSAAREPPGRMQTRAALLVTACSFFVVLASAAALGAGQRAADYPSLYVTFNANDTVTVALANGSPVGTPSGAPTTISPGTYNVLIADPTFVSDIQWDLAGPGVSLVSTCSYGEEPSESWVETFAANATYTWRDDNRPSTVYTFATSATPVGSANSGQAPLTSTTPIASGSNGKSSSTDIVGSQTVQSRGTVVGTVSAAGTVTLAFGGKPVGTLKAGRYTFSITDESKKSGFTVQEAGRPATTVTTSPFTGRRKQAIVLGAGQWFVYPSFVGKKTYFIVIS